MASSIDLAIGLCSIHSSMQSVFHSLAHSWAMERHADEKVSGQIPRQGNRKHRHERWRRQAPRRHGVVDARS